MLTRPLCRPRCITVAVPANMPLAASVPARASPGQSRAAAAAVAASALAEEGAEGLAQICLCEGFAQEGVLHRIQEASTGREAEKLRGWVKRQPEGRTTGDPEQREAAGTS